MKERTIQVERARECEITTGPPTQQIENGSQLDEVSSIAAIPAMACCGLQVFSHKCQITTPNIVVGWNLQDDPLEAFMAEINQTAEADAGKATASRKVNLELDEDADNVADFLEVGLLCRRFGDAVCYLNV